MDRGLLDSLPGHVDAATRPLPAAETAAFSRFDALAETADLPLAALTAPTPLSPIGTGPVPASFVDTPVLGTVLETPCVPWAALPGPDVLPGPPSPAAAVPSPWALRSAQLLNELYASLWTEPPALRPCVPPPPSVRPDLPEPAVAPTPLPAVPEPDPEPDPEQGPARAGRHRRRRAVLGLGGLGCVVAGAVVVATSLRQAPPEVGELPAPSALSDHPVPAVVTGIVPQQITIPGRGVSAPVVPVQTAPDGGLAVPEQPTTVGWWSPGSLPGSSTGTAVMAGHVDTRAAGFGTAAALHELMVGERIVVAGTDGRTMAFTVVARREFAKAQLPVGDLLGVVGGPPRLVLVTCGGPFDPVLRSYDDNVVVYAAPATDEPPVVSGP